MRILLAPHEISGQMQLIAEKFRSKGIYATALSYVNHKFGIINDINLGWDKKNGKIEKLFQSFLLLFWAIKVYDIFHFFYGESLIPRFFIDLPILKKARKKIFVHFRGSDIRNISYIHCKMKGGNCYDNPLVTPVQKRRIKIWRKFANAIFISTPDLYKIIPEAILIPQVIDLDKWSPIENNIVNTQENFLKVVHAPSSRKKKGTEIVINAINSLRQKGYKIKLNLIENLSHREAKKIFIKSDIGIDQMLVGWYGNFSIELMALKKPVLCYIDENLFKIRPDLPIVNVRTSDDIEQKLIDLIRDKTLRTELGEKSRLYVEKYHDAEKITDLLLEIYSSY